MRFVIYRAGAVGGLRRLADGMAREGLPPGLVGPEEFSAALGGPVP